MKSNGPRPEPWGTPHVRALGVDVVPCIHTVWDLPVRYDLNQASALPRIPNLFECRCIELKKYNVDFRYNDPSVVKDDVRLHGNQLYIMTTLLGLLNS